MERIAQICLQYLPIFAHLPHTNTETNTVTNTETNTVTNTDTNREKTRAQMGRYQYRGTLDCTLVSYITAELEKALKTLSQHEGQERENSDEEEILYLTGLFYHNGANLQP